ATDPEFRTVLSVHGYSLNGGGEIEQLREFVGPFSARAAQISAHRDRYEAQWRGEHPGEEPGQLLHRNWDARAWAEGRPDKVVPVSAEALHGRWVSELRALGFREPDRPVALPGVTAGGVNRDASAQVVL